jgi:hypothetical protein
MKIIKNVKLAALAATLLFQTSITRADDNRDHRDAIITLTKWVTAFFPPTEEIFATGVGVAGGDLGEGTLTLDAFSPVEVLPDGASRRAEHRLIGSEHSPHGALPHRAAPITAA